MHRRFTQVLTNLIVACLVAGEAAAYPVVPLPDCHLTAPAPVRLTTEVLNLPNPFYALLPRRLLNGRSAHLTPGSLVGTLLIGAAAVAGQSTTNPPSDPSIVTPEVTTLPFKRGRFKNVEEQRIKANAHGV